MHYYENVTMLFADFILARRCFQRRATPPITHQSAYRGLFLHSIRIRIRIYVRGNAAACIVQNQSDRM